MGVKDGEPRLRSARGRQASDTTERLINSKEEPEGKLPDTHSHRRSPACAPAHACVRWLRAAGQGEGRAGSTAPLAGLPGKSPASEGPEPPEGEARRPPGPPACPAAGSPHGPAEQARLTLGERPGGPAGGQGDPHPSRGHRTRVHPPDACTSARMLASSLPQGPGSTPLALAPGGQPPAPVNSHTASPAGGHPAAQVNSPGDPSGWPWPLALAAEWPVPSEPQKELGFRCPNPLPRVPGPQ